MGLALAARALRVLVMTSRYFTPASDPHLFRCPCGSPTCDATPPSDILLTVLDQLREARGWPIAITSGPRCKAYDATLAASAQTRTGTTGAHVTGEAADLAAPDSEEKYQLVRCAFIVGVRRIGLYHAQACMHVDVSLALPAPRLWVE